MSANESVRESVGSSDDDTTRDLSLCHENVSETNRPHLDPSDLAIIEAQLGRTPRGAVDVAWRCPCGKPGVVKTAPRLPDGTPFPTTYYLTCPRATKICSTLEGSGMMLEMTQRLGEDPDLAAHYHQAHESYLTDRDSLAQDLGLEVPQISGISAGGMPDRVKCLHTLVAHCLAKGPGVNPLGDEACAAMGEFWATPCLDGTVLDPAINTQDDNKDDDMKGTP